MMRNIILFLSSAYSADTDQTPRSVASDLGLHYLPTFFVGWGALGLHFVTKDIFHWRWKFLRFINQRKEAG